MNYLLAFFAIISTHRVSPFNSTSHRYRVTAPGSGVVAMAQAWSDGVAETAAILSGCVR